MKIIRPPKYLFYLGVSFLILECLPIIAQQRDGLRQKGDRYENTGIPNNCDDKIYGLTYSGNIIEVESIEKSERKIKQLINVFPFKSNALAKGVNNKIYAVKADEQGKTPLYEYNPKSNQGNITKWSLPSHSDGGWISGAVDSKGKLYFITTTMENLVRIDIRKGEPDIMWSDNISVNGWRKENCSAGCNFFINQKDELVVKENKGNHLWYIPLGERFTVSKTETINSLTEINPSNDILEYTNTNGALMTLILRRDGISYYSSKKEDTFSVMKIDTVKLGILTDLAGCNNFIKKEEKVVEDDKDELITASTNINESIRLKNILFQLGESELMPESFDELNKLVRQLRKYPQVEILLEGHTDITGDAVENIKLSLERVNSCKKYLVNKGIDGRRIQTKGLGSSKPLKRSGSEKEREINRRVEFKIIKGIG
ncbi:OmpA family protein [Arcicella aurantiaca]|uniref:OmpA family protein n=1 Tax=Arcicella aurantiaca TaxID=591202 RepID=A0A316DI57_9BACT|nr:OmpA family protein [Arcicella aurantiaca]PWK17844.1 OmpA family protein [Arcicella aurantiaca]